MCEISVVMSAYNAEKYIGEAIESVLKQSFPDFELIIIDDGSTDNTLSVIRSYLDKRIKLLENKHDFIGSLNAGMKSAMGKYIARMDADDIMHIDRLRIQYAIMEEEPVITVCSTWTLPFGENIPKGMVVQTVYGLLKSPLLYFLRNNPIINSSSMMQLDFIKKYALKYEHYEFAEDYKWWVEMAKWGAVFYIEPQALLYYRNSDTQVTRLYKDKMRNTSLRIKKEIVNYLITLNDKRYPGLSEIMTALRTLANSHLLSEEDIFGFVYNLFTRNKNILISEIQ